MIRVIIICLCFFVSSNCQLAFTDVSTDQGPVRGFKVDDEAVVSFYGIPYATAPRGENRHKAPLPPPTWIETFNATTKNIICPQGVGVINNATTWTFDCLVLNVFVPESPVANIPVYVYIHGGGYQYGYANEMNFIEMTKRGVIIVTINYRLGLHGLLCLGTEFAPGNAGMKDQVEALRWVKRNIANFGGNPDTITIGGNSAGSASTEMQMLSPMSNGLFTKAILESGSTLSWALVTLEPLQLAERFANSMGVYTNQSLEGLENYFKSLEDDDMNLSFPRDHKYIGFLPCIESHDLTGVERFLEDRPINIVTEKRFEQRPILSGFTTMEGLLFGYRYDDDASGMIANFSDFLPTDIEFESTYELNEITARIKNYYFQTESPTLAAHIDYYSDVIFAYPQYVAARMYAENSMPVYLYLFSFNGTVNLPSAYSSPIWGPGHIAQTLYVYESVDSIMYQYMTDDDYRTQERLRTIWYNFIVYGEPIPSQTDLLNVDWAPLDNELMNFLDIDLELTSRRNPLQERLALWNEVYGHFQEPVPGAAVALRFSLSISLVSALMILIKEL